MAEFEQGHLYRHLVHKSVPQRYTLGVVYEPLVLDTDNEFARAETIVKAQRRFMLRLQQQSALTKNAMQLLNYVADAARTETTLRLDVTELLTEVEKASGLLGDQHSLWDASLGDIVECYSMPCDGVINEHPVQKDSWMLGVVWSPEYFAKIESGARTGYSLGGLARKLWVEDF